MSEISPFREGFGKPERPSKPKSIMWKVFTIIGLILLLLIPLYMINGVISERQQTKEQVMSEIASTWGGQQRLLGPILAVPYRTTTTYDINGQKKALTTRKVAYVLPKQYQVNSQLKPEVRYRGIYQSVVYTSQLTAEGSFDLKAIQELDIPPECFLWKEAFITVGIPNTKGIHQRPVFKWQHQPVELLPGVNGSNFIGTGLYAPVIASAAQDNIPFTLKLSLNGSEDLSIVPVGKQNTLQIASDWKSPSFIGPTLPTRRKVDENGFTATWEIPYFARDYSQAFTDTAQIQERMTESMVGVQLLTPVDSYRQTERAIKYGILFLVLTFSTYFLFEVIAKHRLHPFQYLLIGLDISLFYLLLLAFSEIVAFGIAYAIASFGIISAITLYSKAIVGSIHKHAPTLIGSLLVILYGYLYILLQQEDMSLIFGALGLFAVLSIMMYVTRQIDWYNEQPA